MHNRTKLLLAAIGATVILAASTTAASAGRLSVNEDVFKIIWSALRFDTELGGDIVCPVTLLGIFHSRTITKVAASLIGIVDLATVGNCSSGSMTILRETLPWHVGYLSFTGRLPTITGVSVRITGLAIRVLTEGILCLIITTTPESFRGTANVAGGQFTTFTADSGAEIDTDDPRFLCDLAGQSRFTGIGDVRTPAAGLIFIRLVG